MENTNQNGNTPQFANPTAADLPVGKMEFYPVVEYAAMKTPELSAHLVDAAYVKNAREKFKAGFNFWDKDANEGTGARISIDKFTFVVIETYSALTGYVEGGAGQKSVSYYSNSVKDSSVEPFSLWMKGVKKPIMSGYYRGKKTPNDSVKLCVKPNTEANLDFNLQPVNHSVVPAGVSFHQHFIVWWVEGERLLELKLTTMISREIKNAISAAYGRANRKVKPESVNLFKLAENSLWMFKVTGFARMTKDGDPYEQKGDMFLLPKFECGIVPEKIGDEPNPFFDSMREHQTAIREAYAAEKQRRAKFTRADGSVDTDAITNVATDDASFPTSEHPATGGGIDFNKRINTQPPVDAPAFNGDDLPF